MVLAMIRGAEQQTYNGQAYQSTQLLDAAERLAASGSNPKALSWVLAANAEAHASLGELDPSLALLDRSLEALRPGRAGDDPSWAEYWNRSKVLGYIGACHMRMRRPETARAALDDALHLGEELTVKHQSIYLVDLATTYTQEREPEEACRLADKALDIAGPMHYSTTMEQMTSLRRELDAWDSEACVQQLDERLYALANPRERAPITTTDDSMARYTKSETTTFTFIGRAESDTGADLLDKVEECLIGLNLEPQQGWAWIADGKATAGNLVELLGARIAQVLQTSANLDHATRAALAIQLAESIAEIVPDFDRGRFIKAAQPDAGD